MKKIKEYNSNSTLNIQTVIEILSKHPLRRFPQELHFLRNAFKDIKFFMEVEKELDEKYFMELFRKLQFEKFEAGDTVFNFGMENRYLE